jgi:hypothetical protein
MDSKEMMDEIILSLKKLSTSNLYLLVRCVRGLLKNEYNTKEK